MFGYIKKVMILVLISTPYSLKCISLKNQECNVRKVNKYRTTNIKNKMSIHCITSITVEIHFNFKTF